MNDVGSNVVEREDIPLHPSLAALPASGSRIAAMPVEQPSEEHDKVKEPSIMGHPSDRMDPPCRSCSSRLPLPSRATVIDVLQR